MLLLLFSFLFWERYGYDGLLSNLELFKCTLEFLMEAQLVDPRGNEGCPRRSFSPTKHNEVTSKRVLVVGHTQHSCQAGVSHGFVPLAAVVLSNRIWTQNGETFNRRHIRLYHSCGWWACGWISRFFDMVDGKVTQRPHTLQRSGGVGKSVALVLLESAWLPQTLIFFPGFLANKCFCSVVRHVRSWVNRTRLRILHQG